MKQVCSRPEQPTHYSNTELPNETLQSPDMLTYLFRMSADIMIILFQFVCLCLIPDPGIFPISKSITYRTINEKATTLFRLIDKTCLFKIRGLLRIIL